MKCAFFLEEMETTTTNDPFSPLFKLLFVKLISLVFVLQGSILQTDHYRATAERELAAHPETHCCRLESK